MKIEVSKIQLVKLVGEIEDKVSAYLQNMKLNEKTVVYRPIVEDKEPSKTIETSERH